LLFGAAGEVSLFAEAAASLVADACLAADALFSASSRLMRASCLSINWRIWRISSSRDCACVVCPAIEGCAYAATLNVRHNGKDIKSAISRLNILIAPAPVVRGALA